MLKNKKTPAYPNLAANMAKKGLRFTRIAEIIGISPASFTLRYQGKTHFKLDEAMRLRDLLFPDLSLEYLFDTKDQAWCGEKEALARRRAEHPVELQLAEKMVGVQPAPIDADYDYLNAIDIEREVDRIFGGD